MSHKLSMFGLGGALMLAAAFPSAASAAGSSCAAGQISEVRDGVATICIGSRTPPQAGEVLNVTRLTPVAGPSRPPHFLWQKVAKLRVISAEGGTILARAERGTPKTSDRVDLDHGW